MSVKLFEAAPFFLVHSGSNAHPLGVVDWDGIRGLAIAGGERTQQS